MPHHRHREILRIFEALYLILKFLEIIRHQVFGIQMRIQALKLTDQLPFELKELTTLEAFRLQKLFEIFAITAIAQPLELDGLTTPYGAILDTLSLEGKGRLTAQTLRCLIALGL